MRPTAQDLMYHIQRLGNRRHVARLFRIHCDTMNKISPVTELEKYNKGQMISIGGVLARKCKVCLTARELIHFNCDPTALSGCRNVCSYCRKARKSK